MRKLREDAGLTQGALGVQVGISRESIQKYEADANRPPLEVVLKLADALGVCVDFIARGGAACPMKEEGSAALVRRIGQLGQGGKRVIDKVLKAMEEAASQ